MTKRKTAPFDPVIAERICDLTIEGMTLNRICQLPDMPSRVTVTWWMRDNKEFHNDYRRARILMADQLFDEILDIADGYQVSNIKIDSTLSISKQMAQGHYDRSVRIDARKYVCGKLKPGEYGDIRQVEVVGDPTKPVTTVTRIELVVPKIMQAAVGAPNKDLPVIDQKANERVLVNSSD